MKAVQCHRYVAFDDADNPLSSPRPVREGLSLDEVPDLECGPGMVHVDVAFAGIQYPDFLQAQGLYQLRPQLPYIPGMDATGIVREVGAGVTHVSPGDRVMAQMHIGGLAEQVCVQGDAVWPVPDGVPLATCSNVGRNYFASYHSLKVIGEVGPDSLVLVTGASGGVGMASIELAKAMGAKVIAGVSTKEKAGPPAEVGADRVLCYGRSTETYHAFKKAVRTAAGDLGHRAGVDLVIDVVQGDLFEPGCVSTVRPLGKIAMVGFAGGQTPIRPGMLLIKQAQAIGSLWGPWAMAHPDEHQKNVREILAFFASGAVTPRVDRVIPLAEFARAFEVFEGNRGRGNTVVEIGGEPG